MRRHHLFAAGVSVALLLGAASPAFAKPGHGEAKGHDKPTTSSTGPAKDPKGPKPKSGRVNGGGVTTEKKAEFSVQARAGEPRKGHFNYTSADETFKVRCDTVEFHPVVYVAPGPPAARVTGTCLEGNGKKSRRATIELDATFTDNGPTGDGATITFTRPNGTTVADSGVSEGDIHVRY